MVGVHVVDGGAGVGEHRICGRRGDSGAVDPAHRAEAADEPFRDGAAPGTTSLLVDTVRSLEPPAHGTYVWGGAESRTMTAVRKYVRRELGVARESVSLVAYWRLT
ncbi:MAG: SIP domain-containing protein [Acidimicrobiia bacterium]|nr:SIP domain-containing protein [Acidimicrobiia bacterium]